MTREEITNSQDYKAQGIALDWWRHNGYDIRDGVVDIIDAYQEVLSMAGKHRLRSIPTVCITITEKS